MAIVRQNINYYKKLYYFGHLLKISFRIISFNSFYMDFSSFFLYITLGQKLTLSDRLPFVKKASLTSYKFHIDCHHMYWDTVLQ